jgi:hypothetical protein
MVRLVWQTLGLFCVLNFASSVYAVPKEVFAPVEKIFIAHGFDDNDNVEISLYGNFTDNCFRVGPTAFEIDYTNNKVKIWAKAYDHASTREQRVCIDMLTPFLLKVSIGVLPPGNYRVEVVGQQIEEPLMIAKSTTDSPDEFQYAPVTHTQIKNIDHGSKHLQELTFSGRFPRLLTGCMKLKETRHYLTSQNVLVVLPIVEVIEDIQQCVGVKDIFEDRFLFDALEKVGLLHVRVANGNSEVQLILPR